MMPYNILPSSHVVKPKIGAISHGVFDVFCPWYVWIKKPYSDTTIRWAGMVHWKANFYDVVTDGKPVLGMKWEVYNAN